MCVCAHLWVGACVCTCTGLRTYIVATSSLSLSVCCQFYAVCPYTSPPPPSPPETPGSNGVETAIIIGVVVAVAMVILLIIITVFATVLVCVKHKTTSERERRWRGVCTHSLTQCVCASHCPTCSIPAQAKMNKGLHMFT